MIKNFIFKPLDKFNSLPNYVKNVKIYTLIGIILNDYIITLARLSIGESMSSENILTHALFESYTDHGQKMCETRSRVSGYEREFIAVKSVMVGAGVEFQPIVPCHIKDLLNALGAYYKATNPDIRDYKIMSQTRY